jgi:hypothetical protein
MEPTHLRAEAEALWSAECNRADVGGKLSSDWGAVGAIFRDPEVREEWRADWKQIFEAARGNARASVDAVGNLALAWPKTDAGADVNFDVLLATSNVETGVPTAEQVADAWIDHPGSEDYFFENVRHGIRTPDDEGIWSRMRTHDSDWSAQMEQRYPTVVRELCCRHR